MNKNTITELAPAAPPTMVTGVQLAGMQLADWVLIFNLIYIGLGIGFLLFKWYKYEPTKGKLDDNGD